MKYASASASRPPARRLAIARALAGALVLLALLANLAAAAAAQRCPRSGATTMQPASVPAASIEAQHGHSAVDVTIAASVRSCDAGSVAVVIARQSRDLALSTDRLSTHRVDLASRGDPAGLFRPPRSI